MNVFAAARWCLKHQMYQNAYSILMEGIITITLETECPDKENTGKQALGLRDLVKTAVYEVAKRGSRKKLNDRSSTDKALLPGLKNRFNKDQAEAFIKLNNYRNAFMHAGASDDVPDKGRDELGGAIDKLEKWA